LPLDRASVNSQISEIRKQLLSAIQTLDELEQIGRIVDELDSLLMSAVIFLGGTSTTTYGGPCLPSNKHIMGEKPKQERDVRL